MLTAKATHALASVLIRWFRQIRCLEKQQAALLIRKPAHEPKVPIEKDPTQIQPGGIAAGRCPLFRAAISAAFPQVAREF
ncbi:MAG: hypothetical protein OHK0037_02780 [Elainellaceae cyanobacterium]